MKTERLLVEPLTARHADALVDLLDERVNRYFAPKDVPKSQTDLRAQFAEMEAVANDTSGSTSFKAFVVKRQIDGAYIGRLEALVHGADVEIAFIFVQQSWGQGLATEATAALLKDLASTEVERVWACVTPGNDASLRLCERLGFKLSVLPKEPQLATYDDGDDVLILQPERLAAFRG